MNANLNTNTNTKTDKKTKDHNTEDDIFFREFFQVLLDLDPTHPDITHHVSSLRSVLNHHPNDKFAQHINQLNDTELHEIIRFVERPHGRHHISELHKLLDTYPPHEVGKKFLHHFYEHQGKHLIHPDALKHF